MVLKRRESSPGYGLASDQCGTWNGVSFSIMLKRNPRERERLGLVDG